MATAADILRSVNQVLESQESSRRFDVQSALGFMEIAEKQKQSKISQARDSLEIASKVIQQEKPKIAEQFLQSTGLGMIYQEPKEGDPVEKSITAMAKRLRKKDYFGESIDKNSSESIASAVWSYYNAQNPNAILDLATNIYDSRQAIQKGEASSSQSAIFKAFRKLGAESGLKDIMLSAKKANQSEKYISKEYMEFVKGDYDIQSDIGIYSDVESQVEQVEFKQKLDSQPVSAQQIELNDTTEALRMAEVKFSGLQKKMDVGMASDEEKEMYLKLPELIEEYRSVVSDSNDSLLKQFSDELKIFDDQISEIRNKGLARSKKYRELKEKRYKKRNEILGLQQKQSEESKRKAKFDEIEDVAGLLEVSESEAERIIKQKKLRSVDNIDFVDPFLF